MAPERAEVAAEPAEMDGRIPSAELAGPPELAASSRMALLELLAAAREQHFLGPGDVTAHLDHSLAFATLTPSPPGRAVDLGSGAGVPGLVLAMLWAESTWALVDSNVRRTEFLRHALASLHLDDRVEVISDRAEIVGRDPIWRGTVDLVVARGFGPPGVAAECAAPLLRPGGMFIVADPPGGAPNRWPSDGLDLLGLVAAGRTTVPVALQRLCQMTRCPDRYPRRVGIPSKRPLF